MSSFCAAAVDMASTQAIPLASVSAGQPTTNTASSMDPISQYPGLIHPGVLDGAYYTAVLDHPLRPRRHEIPQMFDGSTWGDIECLSVSIASFEWKTDWQSSSSDAARLCMVRGHVSPKHLHALGSTFRLTPAFLLGHTGSYLSRYTPWPICPPLPSQRSNMGHVRFLTLGRSPFPSRGRFDFESMITRRAKCRLHMEDNFVRQLEPELGGTRIRNVHLHDCQYFSVEQLVSFCFVQDNKKDTWDGELVAGTTCEY
jgi:hypothetical protein